MAAGYRHNNLLNHLTALKRRGKLQNMKPSPPSKKKQAKGGDEKVEKTMHEFKEGELHSGSKSGPKVTSKRQAIAIALSQQRRADKDKK